MYSLQQISVPFQLFITSLKTLKQNIKTTGDPYVLFYSMTLLVIFYPLCAVSFAVR
jgi:hypothetical protein